MPSDQVVPFSRGGRGDVERVIRASNSEIETPGIIR